MALDTYDNLKAAVIRLDGSNNISDIVDDAIDLAESEMYGNSQVTVKHRSMETRTTLSSGGTRFLALPSNFLELRSFGITTSGYRQDLRYVTPEALQPTVASGMPKKFTITSQFEFDKTPDSSYTIELDYFAKLTALDDTNTTNDILTDAPNVYLFGTLWAVNLYNAEEDKADFYYRQFINAIKGMNKRFAQGRVGPAPSMQFEGSTP